MSATGDGFVHSVTILYAPKPWDRGAPLTRTVEVPKGYSQRQAEAWLREKQVVRSGEKIETFNQG